MKYKVGDRIICGGDKGVICKIDGDGYIMEFMDVDSGWSRDNSIPSGYKSVGSNTYYFVNDDDIKLISKGKTMKPKKVNFLLKYDLDEDPIEEFETMKEVDARIKELIEEEDSLQKDSIVIYEVKAKHKVTVATKISKKLIK